MNRRSLVVLLVVVLLTGACQANNSGSTDTTPAAAEKGPAALTTKPPWPLGAHQADRIRAAGLPTLTAEGTKVHFHAHLDVIADGKAVAVPAQVGIDLKERRISPLHTHGPSGIIHYEGDEESTATLGQFLTEWGVRATKTCIGGYCDPDPIAVYVNGTEQTGPAFDVVIRSDTEIALVLGPPPAEIPAFYNCATSPEPGNCQGFPKPGD